MNKGLNKYDNESCDGGSHKIVLGMYVWSSGKALGWSAEGPRFDPLWLSFLFKTGGLWTLSRDFAQTIIETLKWLTQLPTLMQSHSGGDSVGSRC